LTSYSFFISEWKSLSIFLRIRAAYLSSVIVI